jgi:N-acyl-D-amino-acid deacylase
MSYRPTEHLGKTGLKTMQVRGRMQESMIADIVVFNPKPVKDGSGYKAGENSLPPHGLPHVNVNGRSVKRDNKATNVMAGEPIRFPVEKKGRFVKATQEQWQEDMLVDDDALVPHPH